MKTNFPTFEKAVQQLESFLVEQGWPPLIVWIKETSIKHTSPQTAELTSSEPHRKAKEEYEKAALKGLGVAFEGLAATATKSYVAVMWPKDQIEAEYLMFSDSNLKLSVRNPRPSLENNSS